MRRTSLWLVVVAVVLSALPATAAVNHSAFDALLKAHVRNGRVDYEGVKGDARLGQYLDVLRDAQLAGLNTNERKALLLNAYNAFVLKGVVDHWPTDSVAKIDGFFDRLNHSLGGRQYTLDQVENTLLRPLGDPRLHAAAVCGARSCPPLRAEAYAPDRIDTQLDEQARLWVNDPMFNRIDRDANKLMLSMIFKWYQDDFEAVGGPAGFVKTHLTDEAARRWVASGGYGIDYLKYDWGLNTAK